MDVQGKRRPVKDLNMIVTVNTADIMNFSGNDQPGIVYQGYFIAHLFH